MLRQLRSAEKMKRILWIGLLVLIIPAMVAFYGFGSSGSQTVRNTGPVAEIDYPEGAAGAIGSSELRFAKNYLENRLNRYSQEQGTVLDSLATSQLADNRTIMDQAVNLDILRHYAEVNNLTVSMEEVQGFFQQMTTADQRRQLVDQWRQQGRSVESVLEEERKGRVLQKAAESLGATVRITHYEAWQDYLKSNESLVADYIRFSPNDLMSSVTVTDEGLTAYFEKNSEKFRVPNQLEYEYVLLRKDDLKSSITVSEDDVTSFYAANKEDFRLPRKVEASQIFLKLPTPEELNTTSAEALTSITEAVSAKATDLYERAAKGENFASLADTFSEEENFPPRADDETTTATDKKTTAGGYLGLLSEDVTNTWYNEQWTSAVFSMQPGGLTKPIRTANGFAIVQVKNVIDGEIQALDQVRPLVENRIREQKVEPVFANAGESMEAAAKRVTSLDQLAQETSATVAVSQKVNTDSKFVPGIGLLGDLEDAVQDLTAGGRSDVLSDAQRHLVIQIKQEYPAHTPDLQTIRGRVEQAYKLQLAEEAAKAKAEELLKKSTDIASFEKALTDAGTTYTRSRPFARPEVGSIFGGPVQDFGNATAGIKEGSIQMSEVGRPGQQQSFVVWHLAKIVEPSKTDFAKGLGGISQRLEERKREIIVLEYMRDQRKKLENRIDINEDYL